MALSIGETLRKAREERGLSLPEVAEETRIRTRYLQALERDAFDEVGEDFYAKGFLRNYAKALGLDPTPLLETYHVDHEQPEVDEAALTVEVWKGKDRSLPWPLQFVAAGGTLAILVVLLVLAEQRTGDVGGPLPPPLETPRATPDTEVAAEHTPADDLVTRPTRDPDVAEARDEVVVRLTIRGGESWVRVIADGETVFEGIKAEGSVVAYTGAEEVFLRIGNAGAVHLEVNGDVIGPAGGPGAVVEHRFTVEEP
jgi:cytoskeleton protein RodZ